VFADWHITCFILGTQVTKQRFEESIYKENIWLIVHNQNIESFLNCVEQKSVLNILDVLNPNNIQNFCPVIICEVNDWTLSKRTTNCY